MGGDVLPQQEVDLTVLHVDVYVSKDQDVEWWNPEHGEVATPEGWAFLPTGQAFAPQHQVLADTIAHRVAARAAVVGSGRVGRTRLLSLQDRAALAARAQIRHAHADYEQQLDDEGVAGVDDDLYRAIKAEAQAVDSFLQAHRREST